MLCCVLDYVLRMEVKNAKCTSSKFHTRISKGSKTVGNLVKEERMKNSLHERDSNLRSLAHNILAFSDIKLCETLNPF